MMAAPIPLAPPPPLTAPSREREPLGREPRPNHPRRFGANSAPRPGDRRARVGAPPPGSGDRAGHRRTDPLGLPQELTWGIVRRRSGAATPFEGSERRRPHCATPPSHL